MSIPFDFSEDFYPIQSAEIGLQLLFRRLKTKRVSPTDKNPESSRSHFIVKIGFEGRIEGHYRNGAISLMDLAGN